MPAGNEIINDLENTLKYSLKICSYNINGLFNKINFPYLFEFLGEQDVFCCLETHIFVLNKQNQISKKFSNFNLHWSSAERIAERGRGIAGKLLAWKKDLGKRTGLDFSVENFEENTIQELIIKRGTQTFLRILPIYLRGNDWQGEFSTLKNHICSKGTSNLVLLGDCNIRIGELQQEYIEEVHSLTEALAVRKSKDKTSNSKGKQFMEFCSDNNLWVLNGGFKGDEEGEFTYCSSVGESVNDIAAVSNSSLQKILSFSVSNANWSDHFPIELKIKTEARDENAKKITLLPKLIWRFNWNQKYCEALEKQDTLKSENLNMRQVSEIIKKSYPPTFKPKKQLHKQKWFDADCEKARKDSFQKLQDWRKEHRMFEKEVKRNSYIRSNRYYATLLQIKKERYYIALEARLNNVRDVKEWWRIAKEFNDSSFIIGTAVTAEDFRSHFQKLLNPERRLCDYQFAEPYIEDHLLDRDFEIDEVILAMKLLKDGKAPGEDRVPYEFYKYAPASFHITLTNLFNKILNTTEVDESFSKSIIFPIHKKGDRNDPSMYRGISFMNCGPKIFISLLNKRLTTWVEENNKLNEFQAGFRRSFSTVDNIYNLSSIIHLKFHQNKRVYAFFVDFKAAFDCVPRNALLYKLSKMGVSSKFLRLLKVIYEGTFSAVWNGENLSDYFETHSGVKQGCLISPLLFALFLNDLHEELGGGLSIDGLNIRILLYADDIVILAEHPNILQRMISRLEKYCKDWNLTVNLEKSKIMIFRKGGRLNINGWKFNNVPVEITNRYTYLGVEFTPKLSFNGHIETRTKKAKTSIYGAWGNLLSTDNIDLQVKFSVFKSAVRSIQCYAAQVFGYGYDENINKLQLFFLKLILHLPSFTPTYALFLESKEEPSNLYALRLHMKYIYKTLFTYEPQRLPHILSTKILTKRIFWVKEWRKLEEFTMVRWDGIPLDNVRWKNCILAAIENYKVIHFNKCLQKQSQSTTRFYKNLSHEISYMHLNLSSTTIMYIMKARLDILGLRGNLFGNQDKYCQQCNLHSVENTFHFIAECPKFRELRFNSFGKRDLLQHEAEELLNGKIWDWKLVAHFIKKALEIRT
jgi:hypothetical protein